MIVKVEFGRCDQGKFRFEGEEIRRKGVEERRQTDGDFVMTGQVEPPAGGDRRGGGGGGGEIWRRIG